MEIFSPVSAVKVVATRLVVFLFFFNMYFTSTLQVVIRWGRAQVCCLSGRVSTQDLVVSCREVVALSASETVR